MKSAINIGGKRHYAMIYVEEDGLKVEFVLSRELREMRVLRSQRLSQTRYSHSLKLTKESDINAQFMAWMREARSRGSGLPA